jgi:hypothetical protein
MMQKYLLQPICLSSLTNHLDGRIKSHRSGKEGTLFVEEDKQLVNKGVGHVEHGPINITSTIKT